MDLIVHVMIIANTIFHHLYSVLFNKKMISSEGLLER